MKSIIATLVISTLILTLTIMGIGLWRNNLEIMKITALKVNEIEKVKQVDLLPLGKGQLTGADVISIIRYYSINADVEIEVNLDGGTKSYLLESYQQNLFYIPYEMKFKKSTIYEGNNIIKISFTPE